MATWLWKREAAEYLRVSQRTLERMVKDGEVRYARIRGRMVFRLEWLDEAIEGRRAE